MKYFWIPALLSIFLLTACEKQYEVEYRIQNKTTFPVTVEGEVVINTVNTIGPLVLAPGENVSLGSESGTGMDGTEFLENLDNLIPTRINTLTMINDLSSIYKKDPTDPANWQVIDPVDKDAPGFILLDLGNQDF